MAEMDSFRRGTRAEYLARFALSRVGFISPVPREEDRFGIDLFLHLCKAETRKEKSVHVPAGPTMAIQIKNNKDSFLLKGDNVKSFFNYEMPFFVVHVDVAGGMLEIYHPSTLLSGYNSNNPNWLRFATSEFVQRSFKKSSFIGVFCRIVTPRICRISLSS